MERRRRARLIHVERLGGTGIRGVSDVVKLEVGVGRYPDDFGAWSRGKTWLGQSLVGQIDAETSPLSLTATRTVERTRLSEPPARTLKRKRGDMTGRTTNSCKGLLSLRDLARLLRVR